MEFVEYFKENPKIILFIGGIAAILIAILKGDIKIGDYGIPKLETKQSMLLGGVGVLAIIFALFFVGELKHKNNPPTANDDIKGVKILNKDTTLQIAVLSNDSDLDKDELTISILKSLVTPSKLNLASSADNKIITYYAKEPGKFNIPYEVLDGNEGRDTAVLEITVKLPDLPEPKIVPRNALLTTIFGNPRIGKYTTDLKNEKKSSSDKLIVANDDGEFTLNTSEENEHCKIFIDQDSIDFFLKYKEEVKTLIYNPLDTIRIDFCNSYDKLIKKPDGLVFKNRFKIPLDSLDISQEPNGEDKFLEYGKIYLAIKIFGAHSDKNKGNLYFYINQKTGDKTNYPAIKIPANSSPNGWRSLVTKKLLKGEYDLIIKSKDGKERGSIEFEII